MYIDIGLFIYMNILSANNIQFGKTLHAIVGNEHCLHHAPCGAIAEITKRIGKPIYASHEGDIYERNICGSMLALETMQFPKDSKIKIRVNDDYPEYALTAIMNCLHAWGNGELRFVKNEFFKDYYSKNPQKIF